jgi:hypothetical protein
MEQRFLRDGQLVRPFSLSAEVKCRQYSLPLERRMTDFGADHSFKKAAQKIEEHYGITVPISSERSITLKHAKRIQETEELRSEMLAKSDVDCVIAEMDGSLIPIVDTAEQTDAFEKKDLRKTRTTRWKDARLALAHGEGSITPFYGATLGTPDEAGDQLANCAIRAGANQTTMLHCVGDGASWIADQVDRVFGSEASYLVDFFHLCGYVAEASKVIAPDDPEGWTHKQKTILKDNRASELLSVLNPYIEAASVPDAKAPVRKCHRYLDNRPGQFDYKSALEKKLPIGSGEIESAHRYVVQERLKSQALGGKNQTRPLCSN